jgi:hypothetical protein
MGTSKKYSRFGFAIVLWGIIIAPFAQANPFAEYISLSDGDIRQRCQANIGTPADTLRIDDRNDSACMTAYRRMRDLGHQYQTELAREGRRTASLPTCSAGTSQLTCFTQQAAVLSQGVGANTRMSGILSQAREQVSEIQNANAAAIRQYNSDYRHMTGRDYVQAPQRGAEGNRSGVSGASPGGATFMDTGNGLQPVFASDMTKPGGVTDNNQVREFARENWGMKCTARGETCTPMGSSDAEARRAKKEAAQQADRPFSPANGNASTPQAYQQKIPSLIKEQTRALEAAEKFNGTASSQAMQHHAQAQELKQKHKEVNQSREKIDSSTRNEQAEAKKAEGASGLEKTPDGVDAKLSNKEKKNSKARGLAALGADADAEYDFYGQKKTNSKKLASAGSSDSEIGSDSQANGTELGEAAAKKPKTARELLREKLAVKKNRGEKLSAQEEALLRDLDDPMQLAAAEDKKTDAEIERELLERFGMSNVETDAYVKETVEEFLHRTQGALLSMDSEALFVRVNRAHLRFAAKGK